MDSLIKRRISRRLAAMGLRASQADKLAGLSVGFTRDLLSGRKEQPRAAKLAQLAEVLDCDLDYLLLAQRSPRKGGVPDDGLVVAGICEAGVFREPGFVPKFGSAPFDPSPDYPAESQAAYYVHGDHAAGYHLPDETMLISVSAEGTKSAGRDWKVGDTVIVEQSRDQGSLVELTARRITRTQGELVVTMRDEDGVEGSEEVSDSLRIVALAISAIRAL